MSERKVLRSMAESIVALGDDAGCVMLVGPASLAVMVSPASICLLAAEDVTNHGHLAVAEFTGRLAARGLSHPNVDLALNLYGRLIQRLHATGSQGFTGAGKTQEEIMEFFAQRSLEPAETLIL